MEDIIKDEILTAVLVGIDDGRGDIENSLEELGLLAKTAGIEVVGSLIQKMDMPHRATYIGKGKLEELKNLIYLHDAGIAIFNDELSAAQMRNLSDSIEDAKIIDRTLLILDIFAANAKTAEGKIQVELAQLRHRASRLTGMGKLLSRLGGGIGTRGPGESKLETDRRHINSRIAALNARLKGIAKTRENMRRQRKRNDMFVAALVGYTNAGKSSLMRRLSEDEVYVADKLFATLDTTTRKIELSPNKTALLSDTVGFIEKLPHHLVEAFKTTLDELAFADVLIHVVDASNPLRDSQIDVVHGVLDELGMSDKPIIIAYNKIDKEHERPLTKPTRATASVEVSAATGEGIDSLIKNLLTAE